MVGELGLIICLVICSLLVKFSMRINILHARLIKRFR